MKRVVYVLGEPPGTTTNETVDLILVSGVFEQSTAVVFVGDGLLQLLALADRQSPLKALPTYDVGELYALDGQTLPDESVLPVRAIDAAEFEALLDSADVVVNG